MDDTEKNINKLANEVPKRFDGIEWDLKQLSSYLEERFGALNKRFNKIENQISSLED
jgi:hypothetical protein